jgi:hypothetical protein
MKTKLVKPILSSVELTKLNFYADYLGWLFKFNIEKQSALFETEDKRVGYVQKDEFNHLYLVWKDTEELEYIDKHINICLKLEESKSIEKGFQFIDVKKLSLNIHFIIHNLI